MSSDSALSRAIASKARCPVGASSTFFTVLTEGIHLWSGPWYSGVVSSNATHSGALLSIGYEGRSLGDVVDVLVEHNVDVLVDVRLNAISRKPGLSKTALSQALAIAGIEYLHERALGNPKDNRDDFRQGRRAARDRYLRSLSNGGRSAFFDTVELARTRRVALFCYEKSHLECHRSCIAERAMQEVPSMQVVEL